MADETNIPEGWQLQTETTRQNFSTDWEWEDHLKRQREGAERVVVVAAMKAWRAAEARGNSSVRDPDRPRLQVEQWEAVSALHAACAALAKLQTAA